MLQDGIRKKRMEQIEKERKQREQVGLLLSPSVKFLVVLRHFSSFLFLFCLQMFLLKADQMKRHEKEKVGVFLHGYHYFSSFMHVGPIHKAS